MRSGGAFMAGERTRRLLLWLGFAGLLLYIGWIGGPYLRSVIVRDAALTTWINVTAAPISGIIERDPHYPGERVGADGRIVGIEDPRADATALAKASADLTRIEGRVVALSALAKTLALVVGERDATATAFATTFKQDLDATIAGAKSSLTLTRQRLEVERSQSNRASALAQRGTGSQASAETASGRLTEYQRALSESQTITERAALRRQAADARILLLYDGTDAALAKGRQPGSGQALVKLEPTSQDFEACPIGHAAYVDFPGIGLIDIVRARLRL